MHTFPTEIITKLRYATSNSTLFEDEHIAQTLSYLIYTQV